MIFLYERCEKMNTVITVEEDGLKTGESLFLVFRFWYITDLRLVILPF